jgi:hypothetical protein
MKDRQDLIYRALRNLGVLPQGQSPSAEEYESVSDLIDPLVEELAARHIADIGSADYIADEFFLPLGHVLAAAAAAEFGQAGVTEIWALRERAEADLKIMRNYNARVETVPMRTDYPITRMSTISYSST